MVCISDLASGGSCLLKLTATSICPLRLKILQLQIGQSSLNSILYLPPINSSRRLGPDLLGPVTCGGLKPSGFSPTNNSLLELRLFSLKKHSYRKSREFVFTSSLQERILSQQNRLSEITKHKSESSSTVAATEISQVSCYTLYRAR